MLHYVANDFVKNLGKSFLIRKTIPDLLTHLHHYCPSTIKKSRGGPEDVYSRC
jgi:hypothetical protein